MISISNALWTENPGISAEGRLCYDEERLYVHMQAAEKEIQAASTAPLSPVHEDSCLEFFSKRMPLCSVRPGPDGPDHHRPEGRKGILQDPDRQNTGRMGSELFHPG